MPAGRRTIRWTEHAVRELAAIAEYIGVSSPVYAEQTVALIDSRLSQAAQFPESGRAVPEFPHPAIRELIEPYRLIYRVRTDEIEVLSVLHGRRELGELP